MTNECTNAATRVWLEPVENMMLTNAVTNNAKHETKSIKLTNNSRTSIKVTNNVKQKTKSIKLTNVTTGFGWKQWQRKRLSATRKFHSKKE